MKKLICNLFFLVVFANVTFAQSIDDAFSREKMRKDLAIFKQIRETANSGLYKYRTKQEIDSIYNWANQQIEKSSTYRDFYNIICHLTDFEGSLHNNTDLPKKYAESLKAEDYGHFPYPVRFIEDKWIVNIENETIPLGAEIISINNEKMEDVIRNLDKYYTTDGINKTGKRISVEPNFGKLYRLYYGLNQEFTVEYKAPSAKRVETARLTGISYKDYNKNAGKRYSKPFDSANYKDWKENEIYSYKEVDNETGVLTVNDFGMGNENDPRHLRYVAFLDSAFVEMKHKNIKNLIVDVRYNGGGSDPNDLVTYSYLTNRNFQENTQAWISFYKIPYVKYVYTKVPRFLRPLGVGRFNKAFQSEFPKEVNGKYYQDETSNDHKVRKPNKNAFHGDVYLLISPRVASAGSLFAAMLAGNENTTVIGEETMGGYYGHNGHTPLGYILPKSKIETFFSVVNLEQDVPEKSNQIYNRGIIPDYEVGQTYEDYLTHEDTQMKFVLDLIRK